MTSRDGRERGQANGERALVAKEGYSSTKSQGPFLKVSTDDVNVPRHGEVRGMSGF